MEIREATPSDVNAIAQLIATLAKKFIVHEFTDAGKDQFLGSNSAEKILEFMGQGFEYHIAEDNGEVIGVVGIRENSHLYHLFVSESYQGCGLARKLWEVAKAKCLSKGNPGRFTVNSSNNAVPVYESFGFKKTTGVVEKNGVLFNPMVLDDHS
ncbi:GNAT family N-acetyltransferase [Marinobacter panjinensis]|uniref:GNAT family N-acetyltransferase n=1 Tax=Marinobacter panjinensis TaxID=2576384 RepID=A0A4U6R087_9GAMM|nr:GNAT family N-acetyltransferase [Marinobacter panjinensis]MCR8915414.1 GNAT family N-acetyltransferase [Marinobacter panjinensis]TKV66671.1 GNAT family N-acetyltransferase [Marinobacter panjinensis]